MAEDVDQWATPVHHHYDRNDSDSEFSSNTEISPYQQVGDALNVSILCVHALVQMYWNQNLAQEVNICSFLS